MTEQRLGYLSKYIQRNTHLFWAQFWVRIDVTRNHNFENFIFEVLYQSLYNFKCWFISFPRLYVGITIRPLDPPWSRATSSRTTVRSLEINYFSVKIFSLRLHNIAARRLSSPWQNTVLPYVKPLCDIVLNRDTRSYHLIRSFFLFDNFLNSVWLS